jgi:hypothetical protein
VDGEAGHFLVDIGALGEQGGLLGKAVFRDTGAGEQLRQFFAQAAVKVGERLRAQGQDSFAGGFDFAGFIEKAGG